MLTVRQITELCKSNPILEEMMNTGLLPPECRRAVIDLTFNKTVQIFYECYGDTKIIDLDLPGLLSEGIKITQTEQSKVTK